MPTHQHSFKGLACKKQWPIIDCITRISVWLLVMLPTDLSVFMTLKTTSIQRHEADKALPECDSDHAIVIEVSVAAYESLACCLQRLTSLSLQFLRSHGQPASPLWWHLLAAHLYKSRNVNMNKWVLIANAEPRYFNPIKNVQWSRLWIQSKVLLLVVLLFRT